MGLFQRPARVVEPTRIEVKKKSDGAPYLSDKIIRSEVNIRRPLALNHWLTVSDIFSDWLGPRALQPWAMGQCLEGLSPSHHGVMLPMAGPADNLYVHVPTVSSLAGLADGLVT